MSLLSRLVPAVGAEPTGERLARIEGSPHYDTATESFRNPVAASRAPRPVRSRRALLRALLSKDGRRPVGEIPSARPAFLGPGAAGRDPAPPASGLRLTWLGHATVLVEIDGRRVLFDPMWGRRCSPFSFIGPQRLHPTPVPLHALGRLDAVVVSHDHYDHLDLPTVRELAAHDVPFAIPLGVGAHLERWGIAPARLHELDWHESTQIAGLRLTATPARHFCGRGLRNKQRTLWASWTVEGPEHRVFHSGDTGYFPGFAEIGAAHGPFDATMIQVGAYSEFWPDIHMLPEDGLRAHLDLTGTGGTLLPIHWGTFNLAPHPWADPAERTRAAAQQAGVRAAFPLPGGSFEPSAPELPDAPWWRDLTGGHDAKATSATGPTEATEPREATRPYGSSQPSGPSTPPASSGPSSPPTPTRSSAGERRNGRTVTPP